MRAARISAASRVGERSEHEHLLVQLTTFVRGGTFDLAPNEELQLFELGVALGGDGFGGGVKQTQLLLVLLQIFEPLIKMQMLQTIFEFAADFHRVIGIVVRLGHSDV